MRFALVLALAAQASAAWACGFHRMRMNPAYYQARALENEGKVLEAVEAYRTAGRYPGQSARWIASLWTRLGEQSLAAERHADAAIHFRSALRELPAYDNAAKGLVLVLRATGRAREALAELDR